MLIFPLEGTQSPFPGNSDALIAFEDWYFNFEQAQNNPPAENLPTGWYPVENPAFSAAPRMDTPDFPESWPAGPMDAPWKDTEAEVETAPSASSPSDIATNNQVNAQAADITPSTSTQPTSSQATSQATTTSSTNMTSSAATIPFPDFEANLITSTEAKPLLPKLVRQYSTDSDSDDEGGVPVTPQPISYLREPADDYLIGTRVQSAETEERFADGEDEGTDGGVKLEWY